MVQAPAIRFKNALHLHASATDIDYAWVVSIGVLTGATATQRSLRQDTGWLLFTLEHQLSLSLLQQNKFWNAGDLRE